MFEGMLFIVLSVALAGVWRRMNALEERLAAAEFRAEPVPAPQVQTWQAPSALAPAWTEPRPVAAPAVPTIPFPTGQVRTESIWAPQPIETMRDEEEATAPGGIGLEELFGRRLPIWAGGVTLAVAGVLIVRYSIEAGLLSPLVRMVLGLLFGAGLIAAAEVALRFDARVRDPRVHQALAGAGIATLYASILVGTNLYGLISPLAGFGGLAAVTAAALGLSLRFGPPSALLGLVGGLAAPALVGATEPNVPLLTLYLALAVGGLSVLSRSQCWVWLGVSALVGGLGWGLVLILGGVLDAAESMSVGIYLLAIGIAAPMIALPSGGAARLVRGLGSLAAAAQIAALVATGGFSMLHWGLFGLISAAIVWLARREAGLERLPMVGLALALLLVAAWPYPEPGAFASVLIGAACIYDGPALFALWRPRGGMAEAGQIAALALGETFLAAFHYYRADHAADNALALVSMVAASFPAAAALLGWGTAGRKGDARFALLVSTAALLVAVAAAFAMPLDLLPLAIGAIGGALLLLSLVADDTRIEGGAWFAAATTVPLLAIGPDAPQEFARLFGQAQAVAAGAALLRWTSLAAIAGLFAWRSRHENGRIVAQAASALLAYGAAAQLVSIGFLPLVAPVALLGLALVTRTIGSDRLLPAWVVAFVVALAWTMEPLFAWAVPALPSVAGQSFLAIDLPLPDDALLRLLVPALLISGAAKLARRELGAEVRLGGDFAAAALGGVALHILFKQVVGLASARDFVTYGMAERLLWEMLLVTTALVALWLNRRRAAAILATAAVAHLIWYSLVLHNPLWAHQAVGGLPLLNLLTGTYGLAVAVLTLAPVPDRAERARAAAGMLLIVLFAFSTLRQLAVGSMLTVPGLGQSEDIARSILAVVLAIGFLLWGIRTGSRDWRLGSLALMLAAVVKVFLFDASGLQGLLRIASFVALGGSLIGIGWLYSRSLRPTLSPDPQ